MTSAIVPHAPLREALHRECLSRLHRTGKATELSRSSSARSPNAETKFGFVLRHSPPGAAERVVRFQVGASRPPAAMALDRYAANSKSAGKPREDGSSGSRRRPPDQNPNDSRLRNIS